MITVDARAEDEDIQADVGQRFGISSELTCLCLGHDLVLRSSSKRFVYSVKLIVDQRCTFKQQPGYTEPAARVTAEPSGSYCEGEKKSPPLSVTAVNNLINVGALQGSRNGDIFLAY